MQVHFCQASIFCPLNGHTTSSGEEIYGSPHFSEVFAFSEIKEVPERLHYTAVDNDYNDDLLKKY